MPQNILRRAKPRQRNGRQPQLQLTARAPMKAPPRFPSLLPSIHRSHPSKVKNCCPISLAPPPTTHLPAHSAPPLHRPPIYIYAIPSCLPPSPAFPPRSALLIDPLIDLRSSSQWRHLRRRGPCCSLPSSASSSAQVMQSCSCICAAADRGVTTHRCPGRESTERSTERNANC
jgi:hypothetical protein